MDAGPNINRSTGALCIISFAEMMRHVAKTCRTYNTLCAGNEYFALPNVLWGIIGRKSDNNEMGSRRVYFTRNGKLYKIMDNLIAGFSEALTQEDYSAIKLLPLKVLEIFLKRDKIA